MEQAVMDLTYRVFLRSKTVDSDFSFFILPKEFKEDRGKADRLLRIITDIYRDDGIWSVDQQSNAFYCFPLASDLICMRLSRPDNNDISGRPIWTFVGIVVDISQVVVFKSALPDLVSKGSVFNRIESDCINYHGAVPFPPDTSAEQTLNVTMYKHRERVNNKERQRKFNRNRISLSPEITRYPYSDMGWRELVAALKVGAEEYDRPPQFFVYGPGFDAFSDGKVAISSFHVATGKLRPDFLPLPDISRYWPVHRESSVPDLKEHREQNLIPRAHKERELESIKIRGEELRPDREDKVNVTWAYCRVRKSQQIKLPWFWISSGPRYVAYKVGHVGREVLVAQADDLLHLGITLENNGWTPVDNKDWRETGSFPDMWKKAYEM